MKYVPPLREAEEAPYKNFNPTTGEAGSVVPAQALEHPQREIVNAIKLLGKTPDAAQLDQLGQILLGLKLTAEAAAEAGAEIVYLTQAEYDLLPAEKLSDGRHYALYGVKSGGGG